MCSCQETVLLSHLVSDVLIPVLRMLAVRKTSKFAGLMCGIALAVAESDPE